MTESVTIEIPLPPVECSPNKRVHWAARRRARERYVEECLFEMRKVEAFTGPGILSLAFFVARPANEIDRIVAGNRYYPKDRDNALASAKDLIDALRISGLIRSDAAKHVDYERIDLWTRARDHKGRACVELTIRPLRTEDHTTYRGGARSQRAKGQQNV